MKNLYKNSNKFLTNSIWNESTNDGIEISKPQKKDFKTVEEGEKISIGNTRVTVTDPYGIREFEGREGQHSTGIDIVTNTGKAISLSDGIVESVRLQGDGNVIKPTEGSAAGYYVVIKNDDGTRAQYMHLDPMTHEEMKSLKGKRVKRGEDIWGYSTGSGSMTGPHVKVRLFKSTSKDHLDPTNLFRGILG